MSVIKRRKLSALGFDFVDPSYLKEGQDEFTAREVQFSSKHAYRSLTSAEINALELGGNQADNWSNIRVTDQFLPAQIQQCKFYGKIRIGHMEESYVEYRNIRLATGIYQSTVVSSDIGDFVAIHHVKYLAHYLIGEEVILHNISEMETSSRAKFGNGILREGEPESARISLELCNENGGRSILPFEGMQASDAFLWTRMRDDSLLQQRFQEMTVKRFSKDRGSYSEIGARCVIKNCQLIKDVKIGTDAYIKGVNKLKNLTIQSSREAYTQIGEGCELVNGIIGYGCRIFYGVKAVRFILSSFSQLKYGARLINSFLGDNSTISCCEVLNSLIFPAHEQHHNNSFLCAATVYGQSNMAAGATVGSNHNSRAADGELVAGRGFWPGLCVSLKHNSRFASYTLIVKGDYLSELDVRIPFSLISNDVTQDRLVIIPGYWFMYNMYALVRNAAKYETRDQRKLKNQYLETAMLAPDTVNELFEALEILEIAVAETMNPALADLCEKRSFGKELLENSPQSLAGKEFFIKGFEYGNRPVQLLKVPQAYAIFKRMIRYYGALALVDRVDAINQVDSPSGSLPADISAAQHILYREAARIPFTNIGGQLIPTEKYSHLITSIKSGSIDSWEQVHAQYHQFSTHYMQDKQEHALASLCELMGVEVLTYANFNALKDELLATQEWMVAAIFQTRAKDYQNKFKEMVYGSKEEMEEVIGALADNSFILQQRAELEALRKKLAQY